MNSIHKGSVRFMLGLGIVGFSLSMITLRSLLLGKNPDEAGAKRTVDLSSKTNESSEELKG